MKVKNDTITSQCFSLIKNDFMTRSLTFVIQTRLRLKNSWCISSRCLLSSFVGKFHIGKLLMLCQITIYIVQLTIKANQLCRYAFSQVIIFSPIELMRSHRDKKQLRRSPLRSRLFVERCSLVTHFNSCINKILTLLLYYSAYS